MQSKLCKIELEKFICPCLHMQGDSGGPLTFKQDDQHILVGVTSFGSNGEFSGCYGDKEYFVRVSEVRQWIDAALKDATFCANRGDADF